MSANVPPVLTTDARVAWLQPKRDKLRDQILALEKCLEGKVTVEELKDLDVYLNVTNDNCTSEQSMERMEAEIAKLEERETVWPCFPRPIRNMCVFCLG